MSCLLKVARVFTFRLRGVEFGLGCLEMSKVVGRGVGRVRVRRGWSRMFYLVKKGRMTCFRWPGEVTFSLGGVGAGRQWSDSDEEGSMLVRGSWLVWQGSYLARIGKIRF